MAVENGVWLAIGLIGQMLFGSRFLIQWIHSERAGRSSIPTVFWWCSLAGGMVLFTYAAFHLKDIVFSLGQAMGLFIYSRNLMLLRRERTAQP